MKNPSAIFLVAAAMTTLAAGLEEDPAGLILVAKVAGVVTVQRVPGEEAKRAAMDAKVDIGATVATGTEPGSEAVLVFSNGAMLRLGPNTEIRCERFSQRPFAGTIAVTRMKAEPSQSHTELLILRGEITGNVPLLNGGSRFTLRAGAKNIELGDCGFRVRLPAGNGAPEVAVLPRVAGVAGNGASEPSAKRQKDR